MKHLIMIFVFLLFAGCSLEFAQRQDKQSDTLFQVSTLNALLHGEYEGRVSFLDVMQQGDFGLGTFASLDGEMVAVDGKFYQVRDDGIATPVSNKQLTPFAAVTFFTVDDAFYIADEISCTELYELLQHRFESNQSLYAIKISGLFRHLKTRSVPAQEQPYPPLVAALQQEVIFNLDQVNASLAGFWLPAELAEINVAGFHFHAITERMTGGHVLDCVAHEVEIEINYINQLQIQFTDREHPRPPVVKPVSHW